MYMYFTNCFNSVCLLLGFTLLFTVFYGFFQYERTVQEPASDGERAAAKTNFDFEFFRRKTQL